jgi:hypothetical protein
MLAKVFVSFTIWPARKGTFHLGDVGLRPVVIGRAAQISCFRN